MSSGQTALESLLGDALAYAARGWYVLPLHTAIHGKCTCGRACGKQIGKHPRTEHGYKDASRDENMIREWFDLFPNANVGIATGARSGFFSFEYDQRNGGRESLDALIEKYGKLPETVTMLSGGGGEHFWFATPRSVTIASAKLAPGVEVWGEGHYIVAPRSLHASGRRYEFDLSAHPDCMRIADAPDWLMRDLERRALERQTRHDAETLTRQVSERIPRNALAVLRGNVNRDYGSNPAHRDMAALTSFANAGTAFEKVYETFLTHADAETYFAQVHRTNPKRARADLAKSYQNARRFVATRDTQSAKKARELADERRTWAIARAWKGQSGANDLAATLAHCDVVTACARDAYHLSARELCERAGFSQPRTASHANKRLIRLGVIERKTNYDAHIPSRAIQWRLLPLPQSERENLTHSPRKEKSECNISHDAFRTVASRRGRGKRNGIGNAGLQIWLLLQDGEAYDAETVAERTGRGIKKVRKTLSVMFSVEMVERKGEKWIARRDVNLDRVAEQFGTLGEGEKLRQRHEHERKSRFSSQRE